MRTIALVASMVFVVLVGGCGDSAATEPASHAMTVTLQPDVRTVVIGDSVTLDVVVRAATAGTLPLSLSIAFESPVGVTPRTPPCASYGPKWAWLLAVGYGDFAICNATIAVAPTMPPGVHTIAVVASAKGFSDARATFALTVTAAR